jgi:flavin-dependent dehydrogenase
MQNDAQSIAPPADVDSTIDAISDEIWDVVVVGAGPAGAVSAALAAERGLKVLLLEKSHWPRAKTCGGCLNHQAIALLRQMGLGQVLKQGMQVDRCVLHMRRQTATLPLPLGIAISRLALDSALVQAARSRGVVFAAGISAVLLPDIPYEQFRSIALHSDRGDRTVRARVMLACDGINGTSLNQERWARWDIARDAYIGVAATLPSDGLGLSPHAIHMHVGAGGYVGGVRYPDGSTHLGAAVSPALCRQAGGPQSVVADILHECNASPDLKVDKLKAIKWFGSAGLTRKRQSQGGHRVLAVGDACGYIEPFTGEGIAWALQSALEVIRLLPPPAGQWPANLPAQWQRVHQRTIAPQQRKCRMVRSLLRQPILSAHCMRLLGRFPSLAYWAGGSNRRMSAIRIPPAAGAFA